MATQQMPGQTYTLAAVNAGDVLLLGSAGDMTEMACMLIVLQSNAATFSVTVQAQPNILAVPAAPFPVIAAQPVSYRSISLAGAAVARTTAIAAITASAIIEVPCAGLIISLSITAFTAGTVNVIKSTILGTSAA
jgi:hypothetical protein